MKKFLIFSIAVLAVVGILSGGAEAYQVQFVWKINLPGGFALPVDHYTMNEGETFTWADQSIPLEYQLSAGPYWAALGESHLQVNSGALPQDVTIYVRLTPYVQTLGLFEVPITLEFLVFAGILTGEQIAVIDDLTPINGPGTPFYFNRSDGLVIMFDIGDQFEQLFLMPAGLDRSVAFALAYFADEIFSGGIEVTTTVDPVTGNTIISGDVGHLSTVVLVPQAIVVEETTVEPDSWGAIKALFR